MAFQARSPHRFRNEILDLVDRKEEEWTAISHETLETEQKLSRIKMLVATLGLDGETLPGKALPKRVKLQQQGSLQLPEE